MTQTSLSKPVSTQPVCSFLTLFTRVYSSNRILIYHAMVCGQYQPLECAQHRYHIETRYPIGRWKTIDIYTRRIWCLKVEGLPCFKMAALLTHSFQWTAVAKVSSSVYVYAGKREIWPPSW